ncbi:DNA methyltransferase [Staphylococcus saprophyticus]|uniref:DNA methyltransferase n=1 Tax=Staphylococcus saprophyticus TaxID=29385 RepID=UPI0015F16CD3
MKIAEELEARSGWSSQGLLQKFIDNGFEPVLDSKNLETRFALTDNGAIYMYKKRGEPSHVLSIIRNVGNTQQQSKKLKEIEIEFTYPKPVSLIQYLIKIANVTDEDIVLDFFSGSGSTAEAVMKNNINENRESFAKFIMVQLPEKVENSKFQNLCELGEYRISKNWTRNYYSKR